MFGKFRNFCCSTGMVIDSTHDPRVEEIQGSIIKLKYEIVSLLGTGATSDVYKIKDIYTDKLYTCKKISIEQKRRAYREINVLKKIRSDLFPKFRKIFIENNKIHILFDFVMGVELFEVISSDLENKIITKQQSIKYILYMGKCIKALHDEGFVHLDIKLENFLLTGRNPLRLKLIDFGTAHPLKKKLSKIDITVGTKGYSSLELYRGKYNNKCDVWSLGVCFWILLTSYLPFNHNDVPRCGSEKDFPLHYFHFPNENHLLSKINIGDDLFFLLKKMLEPMSHNRCDIEYVLENKVFASV